MTNGLFPLTILIATRNRARSLSRALDTLDRAVAWVDVPVEIVVVDNGSIDDTPEILARWSARDPDRRLVLREDQPGKARALNAAWPRARGATLAFTDDDVEVPATWVGSALSFAEHRHEYSAATGPVTLPPSQRTADFIACVEWYRTLPLFDLGPSERETKHLYGCNMVVRRAALAAVGGFDPRLGPGASGLHEDGDLARRLRAAGHRILYFPRLEMHHPADPQRLTWEFFCSLHRADARSRWVRDGNRGLRYALQHWFGAVAVWLFWSAVRNRNRQMRARGRLVSHSEYLRLWWQHRRKASE